MNKVDLTEAMLDSTRIYEGKLLKVNVDRVRLPDGGESTREYIVHPGAVVIIPVLPNGKVIMERQFRYPHHREFIEFPAGKIDPGEDILATAKRELEEETGYRAAQWKHVTTIHPLIAYSDEKIEMFIARDLNMARQNLEAGEFLEVFDADPQEALGWVRDGKITDVKTIIGLFWLEQLARGQWQ
jgi:ADP-ribose pyrophosphatase